ncbi:GNAT family N-acetyltransferase [Cohnella sp. GCM10027633]|uniref:GNAT family N-acetyltransferase n=1 Tax=unclassified Cohnella TaxID=2636738 RepID=UPI00362D0EC2
MNERLDDALVEDGAIALRYAKESDLEAYLAYLSDEEMNRLTGSQQPFTRERIEAWLRTIGTESEERADWVIEHRETGELLGEVVLNEIDPINRSANIRIGIQGNRHRGQGYGTKAMIHMLRHGFETRGLHRIHLGVYAFNPRAIRVYEKIGFKREGVERDALYMDGRYHDMITMSMLEDEFRAIYGRTERTDDRFNRE